jgi:MarR family transcriptional regulator, temperature-dependent positive regulator of motility
MESYDMPGHLIRRLHQSSTQIFLTHARQAGIDITPVQFAAMDALRENPGIDQAGVAALIAYDRATIGGVMDRLEAKGLIEREACERDRRARVGRLTQEGANVYEALLPVVRAVQTDILGRLSLAERRRFMALVKKALPLDFD